MYLDRTAVVSNNGGIAAHGRRLRLVRNCFVGGDANDISSIASTGYTLDLLYSTIGGGSGDRRGAALRRPVHRQRPQFVARGPRNDPEIDCVRSAPSTTAHSKRPQAAPTSTSPT
ncbi:MAG: hypothetical protein U0168_14840 [Nannocystaceae bacterium]